MDLSLADIGSLATAGALVLALVFGYLQVGAARQKRRDAVAINLLQSIQSPEMLRNYALVMDLPDGADPRQVLADPPTTAAADALCLILETWGLVAHEGLADLHTLDRMGGGGTRTAWRKIGPFVRHRRAQWGNPAWGEWFEWLVLEMDADPDPRRLATPGAGDPGASPPRGA